MKYLRWTVPRMFPPLFCAAALAGSLLLAHPVAEMGIDDDWSYIYSARHLAQTGQIAYNGWATAMEGCQLILGAVFIRIFGFSFTATRAAIVLLSMLTAYLLQRSMVRAGITEYNATVATVAVVVSPLFLPLASTFMTDLPGLFCFVLCLYCCLRALQAKLDRAAISWLVAGALSNIVVGTVRQTAWLGVLVLIPSTAFLLRKRRGLPLAGAATWLLGVAVVSGCLHWFLRQPYSVPERMIERSATASDFGKCSGLLLSSVLVVVLYLSPVLAGFASEFPWGDRRARRWLAVCSLATLAIAAAAYWHWRDLDPWIVPFASNVVSARGMFDITDLKGVRPTVLLLSGRIVATIAVVLLVFCAVIAVRFQQLGVRGRRWRDGLSSKTLLVLLGPLVSVYILLLVPRAIFRGLMYDRYLLPVVVLSLFPLLRFYEERFRRRLPVMAFGIIVMMGGFGIAGTHDVFAFNRARLSAIDEIRKTGVPRTSIRGGWEYDGWTQIEATGNVNEPLMTLPAGAYRPVETGTNGACSSWFSQYTPSLKADYALSYDPSACLGPTQFAPVRFRTWLAPRQQTIYIVRAR